MQHETNSGQAAYGQGLRRPARTCSFCRTGAGSQTLSSPAERQARASGRSDWRDEESMSDAESESEIEREQRETEQNERANEERWRWRRTSMRRIQPRVENRVEIEQIARQPRVVRRRRHAGRRGRVQARVRLPLPLRCLAADIHSQDLCASAVVSACDRLSRGGADQGCGAR